MEISTINISGYLTRQSYSGYLNNWYSRYLDGILSLPKTSMYCIEPSRFDQSSICDLYQIGARVQGHCGAKCKVCGWEKKANAKTDELETHIGLRCIKVDYQIKEKYMNIIRNRGNLGHSNDSINDNERSSKKIKSNYDNQQRIDEHYDSLKIANSKVQMANQALIKLFVCCGIPFHLVQHPFFVDFIKILCPAYSLPSRQQLSANMLNSEISHIQIKINGILENETCLTLGLDGWTSPVGQSFYAFIIFTKSGKEFIHSIQNLSKESHTSQYIAKKIIEVIESVGAEKFSAVVSDNASSMVKAKKLVNEKYENIMPIRCIDHQINLITTDICKLPFAENLLKKCIKIVRFFKTSHKAGETLRTEILENMIAVQDADTLNNNIKKIISNRHFYVDLEELVSIIEPIKKALKCLEFKSTTLADCFIEIIKLYAAIKDLPETRQISFRKECIEIFNKR
ncbi:ribonuclease H-like domain-containing protein [Rhizophagus irregularis DAOM 181602=DAOM 197198]|nr:ribonuclease H-like domain-containing protein [Rhizophagus irregularis DAOM 181602=DAOM 197198]